MNYGQGCGHGSLSQGTRIAATPAISAPESVADQFVDVTEETSESAMAAVTMHPLRMQNLSKVQLYLILAPMNLLATSSPDLTVPRLRMMIVKLNPCLAV